MNDLTEQWKKGKLPSGFYYVKNEFNNIFPSDYSESYDSINDAVIKDFFTEVSEITEVIAKVPSYNEWLEKTKSLKVLAEEYCKEKEENKQLKELLGECLAHLSIGELGSSVTPLNFVIERIKEVLK